MMDIRLVRSNPEIIRKDLEKRHDTDKIAWLDDLIAKDIEYRKILQEAESLRARRNKVSEDINKLKKEGKDASGPLSEAKSIPVRLKEIDEQVAKLSEKINFYLMRLPNILDDSVPYGADDSGNVVVKSFGNIIDKDFELKPHGELASDLSIADFKQAAKVSGQGFYYLLGDLALLDQALMRYAIENLTKKGYMLVEPPIMLGKEAYEGATDLSDFEKVMYKIEGEDLYLIATSEHPICAFFKDRVFKEEELPIKVIGFSPCFRREIGGHGVDTKGLYRVHQFYKIEQFIFCAPGDSGKFHYEITKNAEELLQGLNVPYRVVNICTGDIGTVAAKKYDIEVWMPRQKKFGELVSSSNCTGYQAVRSNIRYERKDGTREYIHTLNSTAIATSRALVVILENYQNADGSVNVPRVLQPYMFGKTVIGRKQTAEKTDIKIS